MLRSWPVAGEDAVEALERAVIEVQGHRALRVFELPGRTGPDDRPGHALLVQQPGKGDAARLLADLIAQVLVRLDLLAAALDPFARSPAQATAPFALLLEHPAEQPAVQRRPRNDTHAVGDGSGQDLKLDVAGHQVVDGLLADQAEEVTGRRHVVGLRDMPAGEVGRADIEDLAL